jgi:nucleoside-diphosphate-sugar epimerase
MKKVLITGITGFLGKSLVGHFHGREHVVLYGHSRVAAKAKADFHENGVEILSEISSQMLNKHNIDVIIHLAGIAHDLTGKYHEEDYRKVNLDLTKVLYDQFLESEVSTFVFISSIKAVVGHSDQVIDEDFQPAPEGAYGESKLLAEQYLRQNEQPGKLTYILRPCMVHGPGNKGNLNLLYKFVKKGIPFPFGAFHNKRSFLSVENFCVVIESIVSGVMKQGTYHLADSESLSTNELVELIGRGIGKKVVILHIPKVLIFAIAILGTWLHLPFSKGNIEKLTENMVVSNKKLLLNLERSLPVSARQGLLKTIKSFDD